MKGQDQGLMSKKLEAPLRYKLNLYTNVSEVISASLCLQSTHELSSFSFIWLYLRSAYTTHPVLLLSVIPVTWVKNLWLFIKTTFEYEKCVISIASELSLIRDQKAQRHSVTCCKTNEDWRASQAASQKGPAEVIPASPPSKQGYCQGRIRSVLALAEPWNPPNTANPVPHWASCSSWGTSLP